MPPCWLTAYTGYESTEPTSPLSFLRRPRPWAGQALYNAKEVAQMLGVSVGTVYEQARWKGIDGAIPPVCIGSRVRFSRAALLEILTRKTQEAKLNVRLQAIDGRSVTQGSKQNRPHRRRSVVCLPRLGCLTPQGERSFQSGSTIRHVTALNLKAALPVSNVARDEIPAGGAKCRQ